MRPLSTIPITMLGLLTVMGCGPKPTQAVYTEQRKVPFFKVLTYERLETRDSHVEVILFEDAIGNCFITSGTDGGITVAPKESCAKARVVDVEPKGGA